MKKLMKAALCAGIFSVLLTGCSGNSSNSEETVAENTAALNTESTTLNLYTWEGMFPQEVLDGFTKKTGIKINYNNFDYDETMLAKLEASNGGDYDLVIADDYIIETVIAEGLAQKLDTAKLSNYSNINSIYQGQFYDKKDEYTVPYGAGVQTIVYDPSLVTIDITGYADLWDESLKDNVGVIANYRVVNGFALKVNGESYNTEDVAAIEAAGEKLITLAPNIRLIKDDSIQDDLLSGEIATAVMYTSQVTTAKLTNSELEVVFPSEGIGFGIMAGFIPSEAPHADAAYAFLDYILDAEISAQCFEYLGYYCTNKAAEEYITEEYKEFLILPEEFSSNMEMIQTIGSEAEEAHTLIWTKFKAACGQ